MSDTAVSAASAPHSQKKERSPSFPYLGLPRAIGRAREFYQHARRHEARIADAAAAWGFAPKSSATLQTAAALLAYGLLEDQGSGEARKLKITDLAFKALEDARPGAREAAMAEAARKPKLIAEYAENWKGGRPADAICISELRIERGFTEEGAKNFLRVYDDTAPFTNGADFDNAVDPKEADYPPPPPPSKIKVGDYVQWTSDGVDQFNPPRKVEEILPDGMHVRVFGSLAGISMSELTVVDPNKTQAKEPVAASSGYRADETQSDISVLMRGKHLEIMANVDAAGLKTLREMLQKYEEILTLMN
jgi:hypothetical protein